MFKHKKHWTSRRNRKKQKIPFKYNDFTFPFNYTLCLNKRKITTTTTTKGKTIWQLMTAMTSRHYDWMIHKLMVDVFRLSFRCSFTCRSRPQMKEVGGECFPKFFFFSLYFRNYRCCSINCWKLLRQSINKKKKRQQKKNILNWFVNNIDGHAKIMHFFNKSPYAHHPYVQPFFVSYDNRHF